jgi:hypothetical protein
MGALALAAAQGPTAGSTAVRMTPPFAHRRRRRASVGRLSASRCSAHLGTVFAFQPRYGLRRHSNAFLAAQRNALRDSDCDVFVRYSSPFNESDMLPDDLSGFVQVGLHGRQYAGQTRRIQALFEFQTDAPLLGEPGNHSHVCRVAVGRSTPASRSQCERTMAFAGTAAALMALCA